MIGRGPGTCMDLNFYTPTLVAKIPKKNAIGKAKSPPKKNKKSGK